MSRSRLASACILLLLAVTLATAESPPAPPAQDDLQTAVEALKQRNRDLERRLTELEAKTGEGADPQRQRREEVKMIVEQMLADAKGAMVPGWLDNLKFGGDLRLRYEYRRKAAEQQDDQGLARYRLRFGFTKVWPKDDLEIGFRIVTGADADPTSTNATFQNFFQEHVIGVDTAYAKWTPKSLKGFTLIGGKMPQPWQSTDIVWDGDVMPEGLWVQYRAPALGPIAPFVGAGVFQLSVNEDGADTNMMAYEGGVVISLPHDVTWTSAVTAYDFSHLNEGMDRLNLATRGNTFAAGPILLAGQFTELNFTNRVGFKAFNLPWEALVGWVHNTNNEDARGMSDGFVSGVKVGSNKKKGDWSLAYYYKYMEADCALAYFAESDFGNGSFTNRKGHVFSIQYNLTDAMTFGLSLYATEPIDTDLLPNEFDHSRTTIQADFVWKF